MTKDEALRMALDMAEWLTDETKPTPTKTFSEIAAAIREVLAQPEQVPVTDNTYNYAKSLAEAIFKQHFASDEHYASGRIVWGVNDTVIGILTQIDNMVADMVRRPAQPERPAVQVVEHAPCQGMNCGITRTDQEHSMECQAEHAAAIAGGRFVKDDASPAVQGEPVALYGRDKAIAECLAVLRPVVKRKFPHEQALEELAGYTKPQLAVPERKPKNEEFIAHAWANSSPNLGFNEFLALFRAIEAAHGIKENT